MTTTRIIGLRLLSAPLALWIAGTGCLMNCLPFSHVLADASLPQTHESIPQPQLQPASTNASKPANDPAAQPSMPCHPPPEPVPSADPQESKSQSHRMNCCPADTRPATIALREAVPGMQISALPQPLAAIPPERASNFVHGFDLPPPHTPGTETHLLLRVLLI